MVVWYFCDGRKKQKKNKKTEKTSVEHIHISLIGGCVNKRKSSEALRDL